MEKEKYSPYSQCCGRPMHYAPKPKCNYNSCCLNEYHYTMPACIRNKQPDCLAKAVIPSITVETTDGITNLANCFVHVTSINTTFYIDDKHRPMMIWADNSNSLKNVEIDKPTDKTGQEIIQMLIDNPLGLKSQFLSMKYKDGDIRIIEQYYYDEDGIAYMMNGNEHVWVELEAMI